MASTIASSAVEWPAPSTMTVSLPGQTPSQVRRGGGEAAEVEATVDEDTR